MSKSDSKVARRYARALFELCSPQSLEDVRGALSKIAELWKQNRELHGALLNPATSIDQRTQVLLELGGRLSPSNADVGKFLNLLLHKGRLSALPQISEVFGRMVDEVKKLLALEIVSAFPLGDSERERIQSHVQRDFGSMATISWHVDREVIGGLLVKSGDRLLDGSVRGSIERLRGTLLA